MIIQKTSTLEFYRIELKEIEANSKDLFTTNLDDFSDGSIELTQNYNLVFNYIKNIIDEDNKREIVIRNKKHKIWVDKIEDQSKQYICFFSSRENHNGAIIDKTTFDITLAQDENLDIELASLSHFIVNTQNNILALEKFDGSTSKTSLVGYFGEFLKNTNLRLNLYPIPRDDLEQVLNSVKKILSFKAKYRDIKDVLPDFLENHIFSKSRDLKLAQDNPTFQTKIDINFGDGEEISPEDTIIQKIINKFLNKNLRVEEDKENLLEGKIDIITNYGSEEVIKLQENLFIEKLNIIIDENITKRELFSEHIYKKIIEKIEILVSKKSK
jgi:hypothetical protein